jgi:hypothetical protein
LIIAVNKQKNERGFVLLTKWYDVKVIRTGHIVEVFKYERVIKVGETKNAQGRRLEASEQDKMRHRKETLGRAKTTVRRLINANVDAWGQSPKFLTLTFAENVQDIKQANYEFKKFRQRLEYQLKIKLKYIVVIEFQKRGAIHYHVVFFNLPYIKNSKLAEIWKNGFIKINEIDKVDNIGAYVTKYMTKEDYEAKKTDKLIGKKSYFTSRGLIQPVEEYFRSSEKEIESVENSLSEHMTYIAQFDNDYLGKISYAQYNIKRNISKG